MHHNFKKILFACGASLYLTATTVTAQETRVYQRKSETPVKGRDGVTTISHVARLSNDRVLYQLTQSANTGQSVSFLPDKQIESTRRPYQPYHPAPTTAEVGFTSLGLNSGSWNNLGFFNLYINDIGFNYSAPEMTAEQSASQSLARFVWKNSQATLIQTFVLRSHDDKLLMQLAIEPNPGVTVERLALQLRNDWSRANSAYGNPSVLNGAVTTTQGESVPSHRLDLKIGDGNWLVYHNKGLGIGPSALMFVPNEIQRGHVLLDEKKSITTLFLHPRQRTFHFALWDISKQRDDAFIAYLKTAAPHLNQALARLSTADWKTPLPPVEADAPLHLADAVYPTRADEKSDGFITYASHPLRYVDANTLPNGTPPQLDLQAAPGQDEQAAFTLYALRDLGRVTIEPGALTGANGTTIPIQNVDVRVVKVWPQQTSVWGGSAGEFQMTPELLVRNDTLSLERAWAGPGTFHPDATGQTGFITGPTITKIPRDTSKQFWLMVRVPLNIAPGTYRGQITIKAEKGGTRTLPYTVEVLPLSLASPDNRYVLSIFYRGKPAADSTAPLVAGADTINAKQFRAELQDIRDHGFNAPLLMSPSFEQFKTAMLPVYNEIGFTGPVPISNWGFAYSGKFDDQTIKAHKARIGEYLSLFTGKTAPMFYGIDEPQGDRITLNTKRADITRGVEIGGLRGKYTSAGDGNAMAAQVGHLDYPVISSYFTNRKSMQELKDKYRAAGAHPLYYWQIWGEYPQGSRLNAGYFLYASGYDGVMPYAYRHFRSDPYKEDQERIATKESSIKNMMASYPCNEGPISTLQWEAARAGIWDLRYLITLDETIKQAAGRAPQAQLDAARTTQLELLEKYGYTGSQHWGKMIYGALNWPDHQNTVDAEQFDRDRRTVAEWILKLQKAAL